MNNHKAVVDYHGADYVVSKCASDLERLARGASRITNREFTNASVTGFDYMIADAIIAIQRLNYVFNISAPKVKSIINSKLSKEAERIEQGNRDSRHESRI